MSVPDILSMMVRVQVNRKIAGDWHFTRGKQHYTMSTQHIYLSACSDQGVLRQPMEVGQYAHVGRCQTHVHECT